MADLARFILALLFIALLVCLMGTRFLSVGGINPNLILLFFLGLFFSPGFRKRIRLDYFIVLALFSIFIGSFLFGFWMIEWVLLAALVILIYFLRGFITGHPFPDFLISVIAGTVVFFVLLELVAGGSLVWSLIIKEALFNLVLGAVFWFVLNLVGKYDGTQFKS